VQITNEQTRVFSHALSCILKGILAMKQVQRCSVTGSYWWAGLIATAVHALVHLPMWGWGPVATFFVSGALMTVFFIWTQDLVACMVAHAIIDAVGLITAQHAFHKNAV
jgi:membrane protease YdiL (CAAX protease family)